MVRAPAILTVAVSSRALFHIEDGHEVFESQGQAAFDAYMRERVDVPMVPGVAFHLVRKLLSLNTTHGTDGRDRVNVVLLSRNSPDAGIRIMNSVAHHGLDIESAAFGVRTARFRAAQGLGADLFLSANGADVAHAIENGIAAATLIPKESLTPGVDADDVVRIAFDGDAVLFSSESDEFFRRHGLPAFVKSEAAAGDIPMAPGPMAGLLRAVSRLQAAPDVGERVRIALVTARSVPTHARPLNTIHGWGLRVDEAYFAGGLPKGPLVKAFGADIHFDDTLKHIESALQHDVVGGHVPFGPGSDLGNGHGAVTPQEALVA